MVSPRRMKGVVWFLSHTTNGTLRVPTVLRPFMKNGKNSSFKTVMQKQIAFEYTIQMCTYLNSVSLILFSHDASNIDVSKKKRQRHGVCVCVGWRKGV